MKAPIYLVIAYFLFSFKSATAQELTPVPPRHIGNERSERMREAQFDPHQILYMGSGCPKDSLSVTFSPDNLSFSLLFDHFIAEVQPNGSKLDRRNCRLIIPLKIPAGMQVGITRVDYRGFIDLPKGGSGMLQASYNFVQTTAGRPVPTQPVDLRYQFLGPVQDNYMLSSDVVNAVQYSQCGGELRLMVDNNLAIFTANRADSALASIDSADSESELVYHLNWQWCSEENSGGGGRSPGRGRPAPYPGKPRR